MAGFGLTTGMGTDGGPGGCLTSRAHIAGIGTDEGPGGLLTSRAHVAGVGTDGGPGCLTSRAHAGMVQGNGGLPADPWMEYILRQQQQQQQQGGPGGVQQGCLGATGHWVNRIQFVPVPPSVTSRSGSTAMHSGSGPVGLTPSLRAQDAAGCGHQGGIGVSGVDPVQQAKALLQGMNLSQVQSTLRSAGDVLQARHRFVPERLGDVSTGQGGTGVFVPDTEAGSLPLPLGQYARFEGGDRDNRDVFTKSEKWLGSPPAPSSEK